DTDAVAVDADLAAAVVAGLAAVAIAVITKDHLNLPVSFSKKADRASTHIQLLKNKPANRRQMPQVGRASSETVKPAYAVVPAP
ncbi:MAG: hypothetical protein ACM3SW_02995, partial [Actinomycetota bacterium]